jgi:hypothetical protein
MDTIGLHYLSLMHAILLHIQSFSYYACGGMATGAMVHQEVGT